MFQPEFSEFKKIAKKNTLVPIYLDCLADLETPVSLFSKVARNEKRAFLLESAEVGERMGRYSFIGIRPAACIELRNRHITIEAGRKERRILRSPDEFFEILRKFIRSPQYVPNKNLPPFVGGLVGYLGYEFVRFCEEIDLRKKNAASVPDAVLFLVLGGIIFDHLNHTIKLIQLADCSRDTPLIAYQKACAKLRRLEQQLKTKGPSDVIIPHIRKKESSSPLRSNMSPSQFESAVRKIKSYIRSGDCIQVVYSQAFDLGSLSDDFLVYRTLRSLNPSPYMFYFRNGPLRLIGSSPEMLVKKVGSLAETRPIAGTRPRGSTLEEDERMETNLRASKKELAEHLMLVDLGRNDLGRVCKSDSIKVTSFARVERYSHVMHLVSDIQGRLRAGKDAFDLVQACFPAGTLTGAPKVRAMQIIDELENDERGPYGGALGYLSFNGDMDLCITIRTVLVHRGHAQVQAGAGIVFDSNCKREYQETINKARALLHSIQLAKKMSKGT